VPRRATDRSAGGLGTKALDGALVVVAAIGLVVVLARLAGALLGLDLVTFATGSMTPAHPQGSVAVAQRTPLKDLRIGDVVTVDRAGRMPITHRVIGIALQGGRAELRLRGDANRMPDPAPYLVDHVERVVAPLPPPLWVLRWAGTPQVGTGAAVLAALAVAWALWPRARDTAAPRVAPSA